MINLLIKINQYLNISRQDIRLIQQKYNKSKENFAVNQSKHINNVYNSSNSLNNFLT